ncbi:hypothetical protein N7541_008211 [Penicillium brevicompactum]|uniref:Uncharacterized protein n=1 Tax=Penicillium brevicompactum TaxID=5074 RepID=A0A9W9UN55_PENBR|nr:hypothetical protein N7541_008211 [Penicillium brevicompactum]
MKQLRGAEMGTIERRMGEDTRWEGGEEGEARGERRERRGDERLDKKEGTPAVSEEGGLWRKLQPEQTRLGNMFDIREYL